MDAWLLAKFHQRYPGLYYARGARPWPTSDGTVPHRLFVLLLGTVGMLEAGEELLLGRATALGRAIVENGSEQKVGAIVRDLARRAFPERHDK